MNSFGKIFKITTWGESHGKAIGVTIDGVPPNIEITEEYINKELEKRKPGQFRFSSPRKEIDKVEILSGIFNGKTTGTPLTIIVYNKDIKSQHYDKLKNIFRPGHADFTFLKKFGIRDWRGGGRASARETVARVAAGAIAKKILEKYNIEIICYTIQIGNIKAEKVDLNNIYNRPLYFADHSKINEILKFLDKVKEEGDSIGGIVECVVKNIPAGLGEPIFDKFDAVLSHAILSIGATKGIEFGKGFKVAEIKGSENNDEISKNGFITNNAGGILGGITTGEDILFRVAIKPIPSISIQQRTIDINGNETTIKIKGRHDVCAIPRINVVIEAMTAIVIVDFLMLNERLKI